MTRTLDTSELPVKKYGEKTHIDWEQAVGEKIPFVYDCISGELTILEHQTGNYVVIGYSNQIKRLRTNHLFEMKIRDLIDPEKECLCQRGTKTQETFLREVRERYADEYEVLSTYRGNKRPIRVRHNCAACGYREFTPTPNNFLRGSGCPACNGSPSFPEICLLLVISKCYPQAEKQKIGGRECDIVFHEQGKRVGLQYDGAFYHKQARKDDEFNRLFLEDESSYLLRIRERGCPKLEPHPRLYELNAPNKYTRKSLQETLSQVFEVINSLLERTDQPRLTDKMIDQARIQSKRNYHYKSLMEEYIRYLHEHKAAPPYRQEGNLRERITTAIRERRFSEEELADIRAIQNQYGLRIDQRAAEDIFRDMMAFYLRNDRLPRQQVGGETENRLHREIKRCVCKGIFTERQMAQYRQLCENVSNYPLPADRLFQLYVEFVRTNQRLPGTAHGTFEKSLLSRTNHRLARKTFSPEQQAELKRLRRQFSRKSQTPERKGKA